MKPAPRHTTTRTGLARALSKLGFCSRSQAWEMIKAGRVRLNGLVQRDPEQPVLLHRDRLEVDGQPVRAEARVYLMFNKPRGLVTTASDEHGRATVFDGLKNSPGTLPAGAGPHLSAVGRLDRASEGLLLLTNDTAWAARLTDPAAHVPKTYHVQVNCVAGAGLLEKLRRGVTVEGDFLAVIEATVLRHGEKNSWLELVLDEGKNRHLRRLLGAFDLEVMRLVRVRIGPLELGELPKGQARKLTPDEVRALSARRP